jgi:hypothetical protein
MMMPSDSVCSDIINHLIEMEGENMMRLWLHFGRLLVLLLTMALLPWQAQAFQFSVGQSDLEIRFDNTFKYSAAYRINDQSSTLIADVNHDDGDRNFDKGLVSNRFDWLGELDVTLPIGGIRVSGAAWYDFIYNEDNDNDSPFTSNSLISGKPDEFTDDTRDLHGRKAELQDAFAYLNLEPGSFYITLRAGRHSLQYGETFFFGINGIAAAQQPLDAIKALTVPSVQFKEILRPVEQVSCDFQLTPDLTVGGYYQFKWHESYIPAAGSYLSSLDYMGEGAESFILGPGAALLRTSDLEPDDSGQGGIKLTYNLPTLGLDLGLYWARYHAKGPSGLYIDPVVTQTYRIVYAEEIETYGISANRTIGDLNMAGEVSYRDNAPLVADGQLDIGMTTKDESLLPIGQTLHANVSGTYFLPTTFLWEGGLLGFELAYNKRLKIDKNESAVAQNTTEDAWALRVLLEPTYYQVISGLDLAVPIGFGWNFSGRSSAVAGFGADDAGDISIGAKLTYRNNWFAGLTYTKYWGAEDTFMTPANDPGQFQSFDQTLADRDFISFYIKRTF